MHKGQFTGQLYGETITIERVNKTTARKLFNDGNQIYLQSCNMMPFGYWQQLYRMPCVIEALEQDETFDSIVNSFEFYNTCYERGYYASFYRLVTKK